jgi:hypothetical protein
MGWRLTRCYGIVSIEIDILYLCEERYLLESTYNEQHFVLETRNILWGTRYNWHVHNTFLTPKPTKLAISLLICCLY